MNTKELEKKINRKSAKMEQLKKIHIEPIAKELIQLRKERKLSIIENNEYLTDLSKYNGKRIADITALKKDGTEVYLPTDEIVEVQEGRLYCSSYNGGIVSWMPKKRKYIKMFWGAERGLDIIGFIDIEIEDDED